MSQVKTNNNNNNSWNYSHKIIVIRKRNSLETRVVALQFLLFFIFDPGLTTNGSQNLHRLESMARKLDYLTMKYYIKS